MINAQIAQSKKEIRKQKKENPYIFTEYANFRQAEQDLLDAKYRLAVARKAWEILGS